MANNKVKANFPNHLKPVVLVVLDGWGIDQVTENNGIALAKTPNFDQLVSQYPVTNLRASGEAVGLPAGQIGNSEVGHMTIGTGRVMYQDLVRINQEIESGEFESNPAFNQAFAYVKRRNSQLHILGLFSTGGVHAHEDHFLSLYRAAVKAGVEQIILHPFLDGRDGNRTEGAKSLVRLDDSLKELGRGKIATVIGRYYSMDRDTNLDRTTKAAKAILDGESTKYINSDQSPEQVVKQLYEQNIFDELIEPLVWLDEDGQALKVRSGDALIFTNFRTDRAKQLSRLIEQEISARELLLVTMTDYGQSGQAVVAYAPIKNEFTLGSVIAEAGLKQARLAETEKYAHATYFLNGGNEVDYNQQINFLLPSNKDVKTHDEKPEMKAVEITDTAIEQLDLVDFMFINYANPDMVGHTANQSAIIKAVETVDRELGRLVESVKAKQGILLVIADHGNAETMVDRVTGDPHTAHTTNPVPCILVDDSRKSVKLRAGGGLVDVAPTILDLLSLAKPKSMSGNSLLMDD